MNLTPWREQARADLASIQVHDFHEGMNIRRAGLAKSMGVNPEVYVSPLRTVITPPPVITPTVPEVPTANLMNKLLPLALSAMLGAGTLGAGSLLLAWLQKPRVPEIKTIEKIWDSKIEMTVEPPAK